MEQTLSNCEVNFFIVSFKALLCFFNFAMINLLFLLFNIKSVFSSLLFSKKLYFLKESKFPFDNDNLGEPDLFFFLILNSLSKVCDVWGV